MKSLEKDMEVLEPVNYIPEPVEEYTILTNENVQEDSPQMKQSVSLPETTGSEENDNELNNKEENDTDLSNVITSESLTTCISNAISQASVTNADSLDDNEINGQLTMSATEKVLTLPVPCVTTSDTYCSTDTFYSDLSPTSISQEITFCSENDINEMHQNMLIANNQLSSSSEPCDKFVRQNSASAASKTIQYLPPCRICGEKASGFHYGVNTCEACKGFFRRSIKRINQYKCVESTDNCVIEPGKRNICPKCRFDKCLKVGMSRSAIKTGRYTHEKRSQDIREIKKLESQRESVPEAVVISKDVEDAKQLSALLVQTQKDMYGKLYEYWNSAEMILNLAKDYHKQHKVKTDIFGDLNNIPEEEFKNFYKTTGIDIDNRFELMTEIATTLENGVSKYINFVKAIPGFTDLSLEDQAALIKVSRFEFWFIGYQRFVCIDLEVTTGMRQRCYAKSELSKVCGNEFADQLFYHSKRIQELHLTVEDIALLRSFVVFSPDRCELKDRSAVEKIQWRLLMCMKYMFELNHRPEEHFLSKVIDRVANLRVMTELNEKRAQSINLEWPVMKNHPLLLELMSG